VTAVDEVDLTLDRGEILSVIGPNGAGKTSLFNLITGLLTPDAGTITLDGGRIDGARPDRIAEMGVARTYQNIRVFPNLTVRENVLMGAHRRLRRTRRLDAVGLDARTNPVAAWAGLALETISALVHPGAVRAEEAEVERELDAVLSMFGERLLPRKHMQAHSLSYANRRRTEISRALAAQPTLLLLDEPTAGMNPAETIELTGLIRAIRDQGITILLIEHKLRLVMEISDRVIVMDHGRKIADAGPREIAVDPAVVEAYLGRPISHGPGQREGEAASAAG
jgi:branched-chain amino acid transport system ATP-binding protein